MYAFGWLLRDGSKCKYRDLIRDRRLVPPTGRSAASKPPDKAGEPTIPERMIALHGKWLPDPWYNVKASDTPEYLSIASVGLVARRVYTSGPGGELEDLWDVRADCEPTTVGEPPWFECTRGSPERALQALENAVAQAEQDRQEWLADMRTEGN